MDVDELNKIWTAYVNSNEPLKDTVCVLLRRNNKIGLKSYGPVGYWLPFKTKKSDETYCSAAEKMLSQCFDSKVELNGILHFATVRYAPGVHMVNRVMFLADVPPEVQSSKEVEWFTFDGLNEMKINLLGPEPLVFGLELMASESTNLEKNYLEYDCDKVLASPFTDIIDAQKLGIESLFGSADIGIKERILLFLSFIFKCYPCLTMNFYTFKEYMKALDINDENYLVALFRAFDASKTSHLVYKDFVIGLSAFDPLTQHGGPAGEMRCRYIFRFYDTNNDNIMEENEIRKMMSDIMEAKGIRMDDEKFEENVKASAQVFEIGEEYRLSLSRFLFAVGQLKFRGTSCLFRSPKPVFSSISTHFVLSDSEVGPKSKRLKLKELKSGDFCDTSGTYEVSHDYDLATHSVKVKRSGTLVDVSSLWDLEGTAAISRSAKLPPRVERVTSVDAFSPSFHANEMLQGLRFFEMKKKYPENHGGCSRAKKDALSWGDVDMKALAHCFMTICAMVQEIMAQESRLVEVNSPAYILGDIHGNYEDLVCFEKTLWRLGLPLTPANFVFLGDYVDRGCYGVEVIAYLFSQKILAPEKMFLLRGNHEIRSVQDMFTFHNECLEKFGNQLGEDVWKAINACFDVMPIAAVVDGKIFCVHGGIPPPWVDEGKIENIKNIPNPLPDPEEMSALAWELMWSDPVSNEQMKESVAQIKDNDGFINNVKRGTAHCFSAEALEDFLLRNGLSHVVRAHEVQQAGFKLQLNGKLLTVFSSSKYCGGSNEAACILADRSKIRTIRLDTS